MAQQVFPPGKSGGLIEASRIHPDVPTSSRRFPPGKSGGLIEASWQGYSRGAVHHGFRRVNPAASLKRGSTRREIALVYTGFRRVNPAASLKLAPVPQEALHAAVVSAG